MQVVWTRHCYDCKTNSKCARPKLLLSWSCVSSSRNILHNSVFTIFIIVFITAKSILVFHIFQDVAVVGYCTEKLPWSSFHGKWENQKNHFQRAFLSVFFKKLCKVFHKFLALFSYSLLECVSNLLNSDSLIKTEKLLPTDQTFFKLDKKESLLAKEKTGNNYLLITNYVEIFRRNRIHISGLL